MWGVEDDLPVPDNEFAVHQQGLYADRGLVGVLVGRLVGDGLGIEHHQSLKSRSLRQTRGGSPPCSRRSSPLTQIRTTDRWPKTGFDNLMALHLHQNRSVILKCGDE
jgi:hypothetical protein